MRNFMSTVEGQNFQIAQNFFTCYRLAPEHNSKVLEQNKSSI